MVDPTSDLGEDVDEEPAQRCANCDSPIVHETTHQVVTWVEDGSAQHLHFCSAECREVYQN